MWLDCLTLGLLLLFCVNASSPDVKQQFEDYYKCLIKKNIEYEMMEAKALLQEEGQTLKLSCNICHRPDQDIENYDVKWRGSLVITMGERLVEVDGDRIMLTPDKSLVIRDVRVDDAGKYICYKMGEYEAIYQVDIVRREKRRQVVEHGMHGRKPQNETLLTKHNLLLFTSWSPWSQCDRCNARGEKRKIGLCMVKKLLPNQPVKPRDVPRLNQFPLGLPCRSTILPSFLADLPIIKKRPSETLMGHCWLPCPTLPAIRTITDKSGAVIEVVRTGEGYQSLRHGKPSLPPLVKRKTIYEVMGKRIILVCPHKEADIKLIRWQKGMQVINAVTIRRKTRGRIRIDISNRLHIRRLRYKDTAAYSCWLDGNHIATIKLTVVQSTNRNYKDYIILGGISMCVLTMCCIGTKICLSRNKKSKR